MVLNETDKQKIEEKERYGENLRKNFKKASWWKKWWFLVFTVVALLIVMGTIGSKDQSKPTYTPTPTPPATEVNTPKPTVTPTLDVQKEMKILQEQKAKGENLTKTAVNLITENKMSEAIALYNTRWNELAKLRVEIIYDEELTDAQKKNIDNALKADQEGITSILSKYEQLYR